MKEIDCVAHNHKNIILSGHREKWQHCGGMLDIEDELFSKLNFVLF